MRLLTLTNGIPVYTYMLRHKEIANNQALFHYSLHRCGAANDMVAPLIYRYSLLVPAFARTDPTLFLRCWRSVSLAPAAVAVAPVVVARLLLLALGAAFHLLLLWAGLIWLLRARLIALLRTLPTLRTGLPVLMFGVVLPGLVFSAWLVFTPGLVLAAGLIPIGLLALDIRLPLHRSLLLLRLFFGGRRRVLLPGDKAEFLFLRPFSFRFAGFGVGHKLQAHGFLFLRRTGLAHNGKMIFPKVRRAVRHGDAYLGFFGDDIVVNHNAAAVRRNDVLAHAGHQLAHAFIRVLLVFKAAHQPPAQAGNFGGT